MFRLVYGFLIFSELINVISKVSLEEYRSAKRLFCDHFLKSENSNIVVMVPGKMVTKLSTIKGLLRHGFDLFRS
jgi:hypothetical protein